GLRWKRIEQRLGSIQASPDRLRFRNCPILRRLTAAGVAQVVTSSAAELHGSWRQEQLLGTASAKRTFETPAKPAQIMMRGLKRHRIIEVPSHERAIVSLDGLPGNAAGAQPPIACRHPCCILNRMAQYSQTHFDASFGALSDATRRGVLEQLGRADASITA